jgi:hypothetical protein
MRDSFLAADDGGVSALLADGNRVIQLRHSTKTLYILTSVLGDLWKNMYLFSLFF